eukprot:COSAG02_NODE_24412_length_689_cov_0.850847_2_plen_42_part_01
MQQAHREGRHCGVFPPARARVQAVAARLNLVDEPPEQEERRL